jgi:glycosyltransferase involved in cell wall biosynthesis
LKLSICIPTYNRASELRRLFQSISPEFSLDIVVCDDGSTDETLDVIREFKESLCINYIFQENQGRSTAIVQAIKSATGDYVILMDSDDLFLADGLITIFNAIEDNIDKKSLVFGVVIKKGKTYVDNLPPKVSGANLLSLRADHGVVGDLKEVTQRDLLMNCIYPHYSKYRRVPTSLFWSCVAEKTNSIIVSKTVVIKEYLPGGMTNNILLLKSLYPTPLVDLYDSLVKSSRYRSKMYRWRSLVLLVRYSLHARALRFTHSKMVIVFFPAFLIFIYDIFMLKINKIREKFR